MKKIISILAAATLTVSAFATGSFGVNPKASGVSLFDATTTLSITNSFPSVYDQKPVVIINGLSTNNAPFSVSGITVSNFILTVTTLATTNASVAWQSFAGAQRLQYGQLTSGPINAATTVTNTFTVPYFYTPSVVMGSTGTNAVISSTTTTNFILSYGVYPTNQIVNWMAVGVTAVAGNNTVTQ